MKLIAKQDMSKKRSYEYEIFLENTNNKIYNAKFSSRKDWIMKQLYIYNNDNSLIYEIKQEDNTVSKIIFNYLKRISNPIPADRCKFYIYQLGEKIGYILCTTKHGSHIEAEINGVRYEAWNLYNNYISVYENDEQIALIERNKMDWYDADIYCISCNDDVSKEVIIILNLIIDIECFTFSTYKSRDCIVRHRTSRRKFDKNWVPNQNK
jgi:hypothetical protein